MYLLFLLGREVQAPLPEKTQELLESKRHYKKTTHVDTLVDVSFKKKQPPLWGL